MGLGLCDTPSLSTNSLHDNLQSQGLEGLVIKVAATEKPTAHSRSIPLVPVRLETLETMDLDRVLW